MTVMSGTVAARSQSLATAIKAHERVLNSSPTLKGNGHRGNLLLTVGTIKKYAPDAGSLSKQLDHAATAVSRAVATPAQRKAQRDWVKGAHEEAAGFLQTGAGFDQILQGHANAGNPTLALARKKMHAGHNLDLKPTND
jgi:hypothetical protein